MNGRVIAVIQKSKGTHIAFAKKSETFCGTVAEGDAKVLDDYQKLSDICDDICHECESEYQDWIDSGGERCPTVRCECDMISARDGIETCDSVVSAYRAREIDNRTSGGSHPVCENCYKWMASSDVNDINKSYDSASPWLEKDINEPVRQN